MYVPMDVTLKHTVDFLEHCDHVLEVVVVQEPYVGISVILIKWNYM